MEHLIYLFNRGESATVMNVAVAQIPSADITDISDELAREIYIVIAKENGDIIDPAVIASWTLQTVADELRMNYSYFFDAAAVVPVECEAAIRAFGDKMISRFGDDSACYEATGDFGDYLRTIAVVELDFPEGSDEY